MSIRRRLLGGLLGIVVLALTPAAAWAGASAPIENGLVSPVAACGPCDGKVSELTLRYLGTVRNADVQVFQRDRGEQLFVFQGIVQPGASFTIAGKDRRETLGPQIRILVNGVENARIQTSCEEPIGPGLVAGDFAITEGESRKGGALCRLAPPPPGPSLRATRTTVLLVDADGSLGVSPGDTLQATAVVTNPGTRTVGNAVYHEAPDAAVALAAGSVLTSQGTVAAGNAPGDSLVTVDLGSLTPGASATVTFEAVVRPFAAGIGLLAGQGFASGDGVPGVPTDDPGTPQAGDATLTPLGARALLDAVQSASLRVDADGSSGVSPGDTLRYTVVLRNGGTAPATGIVFAETPGPQLRLVSGSVTAGQGTVTAGNAAGDSSVAVDVGGLPPGGAATITFEAILGNTLPAGTAFVSSQGLATSAENPAGEVTDDPATLADDDPTRTPVQGGGPLLSAVKLDTLLVDADGDGRAGAGDILRYVVILTNHGGEDATGVVFTDVPDASTILAVGTTAASPGAVAAGNAAGDTDVEVGIGTLAAGESAAVAFAVAVADPLPSGAASVANQGSVASDGRPALLTDDPSTPVAGDPRVTPLASTARAALGDFVWEDQDGDGLQDAGEPGLAGVTVRLLDAAGNLLRTATTGTGGSYLFEDLEAGDYGVGFVPPAGFVFTGKDRGADDAKDSDADPATGRTAPVAVTGGGSVTAVDAGLYRPVSVTGLVWDDGDGDGLRSPGERGFPSVVAELLDGAGQAVATASTDPGGFYRFDGRAPGDYAVRFFSPAGYAFSPRDQGTEENRDSDADPATGRTAPFSLASGESSAALDAGLSQPITTLSSSPASGEVDVALVRETIFRLSSALSPSAVVDSSKLYAEFGGRRLSTRIHVAPDRRTVTLFYLEPLPASARVRVTFVGDGLPNQFGNDVDADGNTAPGGVATIDFDTLSMTTVPGTRVCGRVFASELAPGDSGTSVNVPLEGVTIHVEGSDTLKTTTDALGNFCLDPAPVGKFFVLVDGRTAVNGVPPGTYYPAVGKPWESIAGQEVNVGNAFLPLVPVGTLKPVSRTEETELTFAPSVLAQFPEFEGTMVMVPADSLYADDGTRGGMVGIAPVPPDRLPGQLPPGLEFPLVITVQTDGATNFDRPVPACFPNLPDPVTGGPLAPGEKNGLFSFNHDIGVWEHQGPMTVTPDGRLICTDPGVGIVAPGWHGSGPPPSGPPPPPPPPPCPPGQTQGCTPPPPPPPCPRPPDPDLGFKLQLCAQERDNGFNSCSRTAAAFSLAATLAYTGAMAACVAACGSTLIGCAAFPTCYASASFVYTSALTMVSVNLNNCIQDKVDAYELCVKRAMGPPPPPCKSSFSLPFESTGPPLQGLRDAATDPVIDQITQIMNEIHSLLEPFTNSGEQPPPSVLQQAADLRAQADLIAGGSATDVLRAELANREATLQPIDDPTSPARGNAPPYPILYMAEIQRPSVKLRLRGQTLPNGQYTLFVPRDGSLTSISFYDPRTKSFGIEFPRVTPNLRYRIPRVHLAPLDDTANDADQDGLADSVEAVYGTDPYRADSDNDGVSDGAEVEQGTNPLDGQPVQTGIIASADTAGTAVDVCAVNDVAVVADSSAGVSVFNAFNGMEPKIVAQVDTPGTAQAVSCGGNLIAVADGSAGLAVLDVTDPPAARILHQLELGGPARSVAVAGNVAFVGLGSGQIVSVDLPSGTILERVTVGGALHDLALNGDTLYALTQGTLYALPVFNGPLQVSGSASSPGSIGAGGRRLRLFAGGRIAYAAHTAGYNTFDLTIPEQPVLITAGRTTQFGWKQIVANGSGLGVAAVDPNSTNDGAHDVSLYDVSDPEQTDVFLTRFTTPGLAAAVSIYNGLAYVADSQSGLQVINYLPYDAAGVAPTITLSTNFGAGVAEEGKVMRVTADVGDDVQVRNVEFYVDGARVLTDGNFPFEHRFTTPLLSQQASFTLRACATDTGGNRTCTAETTLTLTADATPPRVTGVTPQNGASVGQGTVSAVSAVFSEPIDAATLSGTTFRLFAAGPDGIAGNADDVAVSGGVVSYREDINRAFLTFSQPLQPELYRAVVSGAAADLAGNPVGADFVWTFRIRGPLAWINPAGGLWSDAANWSNGVVPGPSDIAFITLSGNYTVLVDRTVSVGTLTLGGASGSPTLWIQGNSSSNTTFTVNNDFTSNATIRLESQNAGTLSGLVVNGLLTNTGTINVEPGSGGARRLEASFNNLGLLNVNAGLTLSKLNGVYRNEGEVRIATGQKLTVSSQGQVFNHNNGSIAGNGFVEIAGAVFNFNGGTVTGASPVISDSTLNIGPGSTGAAAFILRGANPRLSGNIAAGQTVWIRGDSSAHTTAVAANGFTNGGTLRLESQNAATNSNLTVTNGVLVNTGVIEVNTGSGGSRDFNGNLDNRGTINLNQSSTFVKAGGTYANQGQIRIAVNRRLLINGGNQLFRQDGGSVEVNGTFELTASTFNFNSGNLTGSPVLVSDSTLSFGPPSTGAGTFVLRGSSPKLSGDIPAGATVWVRGDSSAHTTAVAAGGFTNAGILRLESQNAGTNSNLTVTSGALINTGVMEVNTGSGGSRDFNGNLDNRGLLKINANFTLLKPSGGHRNEGQVQIAAGRRFLVSGQSQVFSQEGGGLEVAGTFELTSATLNFNGGTATGAAVILSDSTLSFGPASTGAGSFVLRGSSPKLSGNIAAGQTVWIRGDSSAHTTATAAGGFTNAGTLRLESQNAGTNSNLTVASGVLVNTGVMEVNPGSGGSRDFNGNLDNRGLLKVDQNFNLVKPGGSHRNEGQVQIAAGRRLLISGQSQVFSQEGGSVEASGSFEINSATLNLNGGTMTGAPVILSDSTLSFGPASTGAGSFVLRGSSPKLSGDIPAGATVWIRGDGSAHTTATAASGFTNAGTLRLESQNAGTNSNLTVTSGTLINTGLLEINPGSGGGRTLAASLVNQGAFSLNTNATFTGSTFANDAGGVLRGSGNLTLSTATLSNAGQVSPGSSPGVLTLTRIAQSPAGAVNVEIGGTAAGSQFDQLNVTGAATLDGTLNISLINGFTPSLGQTFRVVGWGSRAGTFTTINGLDIGGGLRFEPSYGATGLTLTVVASP
jgi:uncharacterized repeat protein (TIGR01451 family)